MKKTVTLSIRGQQSYADQEPDVLELVTEGTLEAVDSGWRLSYEESDLTGLEGVNTTFQIQDKTVTLIRSGKINSQMVFQEGIPHDSLYQMEFGALMLTVCAVKVDANLSESGGTIDLKYRIEVEQNDAGMIEYHLDIQMKKDA